MNPLRKALDRWLGRGEASITTPPMDGAFRPNDLLDSALDGRSRRRRPIVWPSRRMAWSSPRSVRCSASTSRTARQSLPSTPRSARWPDLPDGGAAVGLIDGSIVFVGGRHDGKTIAANAEVTVHHRAGARAGRRAARRQRLGDERAGRLEARPDGEKRLRVGVADRPRERRAARRLAADLAYPNGLLEEAGSIVVSESWRSALTRISPGAAGRNEPVLENLPAYPGRLSRGARQCDLARPVRAAQPARRIRVERRPLSPTHDRRDRRRLLGRAMPSRRPVARWSRRSRAASSSSAC